MRRKKKIICYYINIKQLPCSIKWKEKRRKELMKKAVHVLLATALLLSTATTSFAKESSSEVTNPKAVVIREDVSREEALGDSTYDANHDNGDVMLLTAQDVHWEVWGEIEYAVVSNTSGAYPLGYSEHKNGDTVLDTYHYTRTYLGEMFKRGDSGRKWGTGTVKAKGTFCDDDVWITTRHIVKYGTEE